MEYRGKTYSSEKTDEFRGYIIAVREPLGDFKNSEEYFVGTSEDWTIGNFLGIYRGSPPSVYSEELSDDLVVLGVSSEIQFLGIPSDISEGFPRKNEFPKSYFRGLLSSEPVWYYWQVPHSGTMASLLKIRS
ncbi:hypothetical protein DY000_02059842 [Brassica cretica]|uniref:Uncharacterized protein n=1 Tax=Brassica cretica TaxID=69181 RepID=A0ABQ7B3T3_BRACR|nr:hypothetical protein DY000_02059842 [Brassica cretica]